MKVPAANGKPLHGDPVVILGVGPAGLAAAYELARDQVLPWVFEKAHQVGGLARTEIYQGYCFDIGGHRFFTELEHIWELWQEIAGDDFLRVSRLSRIFFKDRFFNYPLDLFNTLSNLGMLESLLIVLSFCKTKLFPYRQEETFEKWIINRFGSRLYETFFKAYTEKVWGIPCSRIRADWAAQRIEGLSLVTAVSNALLGTWGAKTLIDEFHYPLKGPGMMWARMQRRVEELGGRFLLNSPAVGLRHQGGRIEEVIGGGGRQPEAVPAGHLISTVPLADLVSMLDPQPPPEVVQASRQLKHRAFILVGFIVDRRELFPDQWIYIHSPSVRVARIQNFKNWSADMVPDPEKTSVGMEYFCTEGDGLWRLSDEEMVALAAEEMSGLGLVQPDEIVDGFVVRQSKAYPMYDRGYDKHLAVVNDFLRTLDNLQSIGRSGAHRYNNMDQSMEMGITAARNLLRQLDR